MRAGRRAGLTRARRRRGEERVHQAGASNCSSRAAGCAREPRVARVAQRIGLQPRRGQARGKLAGRRDGQGTRVGPCAGTPIVGKAGASVGVVHRYPGVAAVRRSRHALGVAHRSVAPQTEGPGCGYVVVGYRTRRQTRGGRRGAQQASGGGGGAWDGAGVALARGQVCGCRARGFVQTVDPKSIQRDANQRAVAGRRGAVLAMNVAVRVPRAGVGVARVCAGKHAVRHCVGKRGLSGLTAAVRARPVERIDRQGDGQPAWRVSACGGVAERRLCSVRKAGLLAVVQIASAEQDGNRPSEGGAVIANQR